MLSYYCYYYYIRIVCHDSVIYYGDIILVQFCILEKKRNIWLPTQKFNDARTCTHSYTRTIILLSHMLGHTRKHTHMHTHTHTHIFKHSSDWKHTVYVQLYTLTHTFKKCLFIPWNTTILSWMPARCELSASALIKNH